MEKKFFGLFILAIFISLAANAAAEAAVTLGAAGDFAILSKTAITDTPASAITGNVGASPISGTSIGVTCAEVTGTIYSVDAAGPLPCRVTNDTLLTTSISNMETAYTDAAGRTAGVGPFLNRGAGTLTGLTLYPGVYTWGTNVTIPTDLTLDCQGNSDAVFIFQITGTLGIASAKQVILSGNCKASNIFWQVNDATTLGTTSVFYGTILDFTNIAIQTGATLNGRALAQTAVSLDHSTVLLDITAPTITNATTIGFAGADPDVFYGPDQNIKIRLIAADAGSGIASLDVNFYDINGTSAWVRATKIDANTYYINTGHGWTHSFAATTLKIRVNDNAGNSTASTALSNPIVLNSLNTPSGLGGATTNFNSISDFSAVPNLTFEKVGFGKIIFMSPVNLSDPAVMAQLQSVATAITFGNGLAGNKTVSFNTAGFGSALNGIDVNVFMYGLPFASKPGLLHDGARCDNNAAACTTSYAGGTFNFISTLGFSQYDADGNAPVLTNATTASGNTATLKVTINEQATCKYAGTMDKNYNAITDVNATGAAASASWALADLNYSTAYTKYVWCRDLAGNDSNRTITFTTGAAVPATTVNLGTAGNFIILAKTGISTTGVTSITGDIGVSPIDSTAITGFGLAMDASNQFSTTTLINGKVYASDYAAPTPTNLTTAISDMITAYNTGNGMAPDVTELGAGNIGGMTLAPGVYYWSTGLTIPADVTLAGSSTDVWVFQIAQTLDISSATQVYLSGGARAENVFWIVTGQTTLGTNSVFNGTILDQTKIAIQTGATLNGRALAQTAVTLDSNPVSPGLIDSTPPTVPANFTATQGGSQGTAHADLNWTFSDDNSAYSNFMNNNLAVYWRLNEGSGTTAFDSSGNGKSGTITNATYADGKMGKALSFAGSAGDVNSRVVSSGIDMSGYAEITASVWVKPLANLEAGRILTIGSEWHSVAQISYSTEWLGAYAGNTEFGAGANLVDGKWHNIVLTFKGKNAKLYLDGTLLTYYNGTASDLNVDSSENVVLGVRYPWMNWYYKGLIDEAMVFNNELSAADVNTLYLTGALRYDLSRSSDNGSTWSNVASLYDLNAFADPGAIDITAPSAPAGLAVDNATTSSLDVNWNASTDTGKDYNYQLAAFDYFGNNSANASAGLIVFSGMQRYWLVDNFGKEYGPYDSNIVQITGLSAGTEYCFNVKAQDYADNNSLLSGTVCTSTASDPTTPGTGTGGGGSGGGGPATPACTSYAYSDWSACSANGQQTRTVVSSLPARCINGALAMLTQACTPPAQQPAANQYPYDAIPYENSTPAASAGTANNAPTAGQPGTANAPTSPTGFFGLGSAGDLMVPAIIVLLGLIALAAGLGIAKYNKAQKAKAEQKRKA